MLSGILIIHTRHNFQVWILPDAKAGSSARPCSSLLCSEFSPIPASTCSFSLTTRAPFFLVFSLDLSLSSFTDLAFFIIFPEDSSMFVALLVVSWGFTLVSLFSKDTCLTLLCFLIGFWCTDLPSTRWSTGGHSFSGEPLPVGVLIWFPEVTLCFVLLEAVLGMQNKRGTSSSKMKKSSSGAVGALTGDTGLLE